jgi:hypothetical protein
MSFQNKLFLLCVLALVIAAFFVEDAKSQTTTCENFNICANITSTFQGICVSNCTVVNCQNTNGGIRFCAKCNGGQFEYCNKDIEPSSNGFHSLSSFILIISILAMQLFLQD